MKIHPNSVIAPTLSLLISVMYTHYPISPFSSVKLGIVLRHGGSGRAGYGPTVDGRIRVRLSRLSILWIGLMSGLFQSHRTFFFLIQSNSQLGKDKKNGSSHIHILRRIHLKSNVQLRRAFLGVAVESSS